MATLSFYPLSIGNTWHYRIKDGSTYTNSVINADDSTFIMHNTMTDKTSKVRREGSAYRTDAFESDNFQVMLRDDLQQGDTWEITFSANGFDNILVMNVVEFIDTKEVEGRVYSNIVMIEAESKILMNGNIMPLNFRTQYYYSRGVGLVLTTSSHGDYQALFDFVIH